MANQTPPSAKHGTDPFASGGNPPDIRKLVGFRLVESNRDRYLRLYVTSDVNMYFEFLKDDVVASEQAPSGRMLVWIKPTARVDMFRVTSNPVDLLQGQIESSFLRSSSVAARMIGLGKPGCCITGPTDPSPFPEPTQQAPGTSCGLCPGTFSDCNHPV
jgi:hypothetical protein